jgi:RNA polymerase sigma-70 factor (ECF subfamily)
MQSFSDEKFITWAGGLRRSDRAVFAELFEETYDSLFGFARYVVRDSQAAHDVLQDVYMKLWKVRTTIDPSRSLKALMYQMVRNYALNHLRQKKTRTAESIDEILIDPASDVSVEETVFANALNDSIQHWIAKMPDRRREAFVLSRFEGLSHEEIARVMSLTPRTVNNHIVLALQDLRARLQAYEAESTNP